MTDATFAERYPFLFHGTRYMTAILRSGVLRRAPVGDRHVSLTTNMAEANHWAMVARDDDEGDGTIMVLSTAALLAAGHRPRRFWSEAAERDEQEWAVHTDIPLGRLVAGFIRPFPLAAHAAALEAAAAAELTGRTDVHDLAEEDKPIWNEAFDPPPWSAVRATEYDDTLGEDDETYLVVCDGFHDETPIVCSGTKDWPLHRANALILAASLDFDVAARKMVAAFSDAADAVIEGAFGPDMLAALRDTRAAIAKAEGDEPQPAAGSAAHG